MTRSYATQVAMWSIAMPYIPVAAWLILICRWKWNFVRLTRFTRRPIPKKPALRDPTGGYHPWLEAQVRSNTVFTLL